MPCLRLAWLPCHVSRPLGFRDGREFGEMTPAVWYGVQKRASSHQAVTHTRVEPQLPPCCPHFLDVVPRPSR